MSSRQRQQLTSARKGSCVQISGIAFNKNARSTLKYAADIDADVDVEDGRVQSFSNFLY